MDKAAVEQESDASPVLKPCGKLLSGARGVSAPRIAEQLGVSPNLIKKLAQPIGTMKMRYRNPFDVYNLDLAITLQDHPEVLRAQQRRTPERQARRSQAAQRSADTRRQRCAAHLTQKAPELQQLYESLVEELWSPSSEADLLGEKIYQALPAKLWRALAPRKEREEDAIEIIVDILWACPKMHTWKVTDDGTQEPPLVLDIWHRNRSLRRHKEKYENVFAAASRHLWYDTEDAPKYALREMALERL